MSESQDNGNKPSEGYFNPCLGADVDPALMLQQPDFRPTCMEHFQALRVLKERKYLFASQRDRMFKAEVHYKMS